MSKRPPIHTRLELLGVRLLALLLRPIPLRWVSLPGMVLGWLLFAVLRVYRRQTIENVAIAFGDRFPPVERVRVARDCYLHFGAVITEFLSLPRLAGGDLSGHVAVVNPHVLLEAHEEGHGVLLVSGHLGNWELIGPAVAALQRPISLYVGAQHNALVDDVINAIRSSVGVTTISKHAAMRGMIRALRRHEVMGMLPDQHYSRQRHFVRFFGRPVSAPPGAPTLLRHTGATLVFAECVRVGPFRYALTFRRLTTPEPGDDAELDLLRVQQRIIDALEAAVRRHPEQYFWMHRRFRKPPPDAKLSPANRAFLAEIASDAPPVPPEAGATP